MSSQEQQDGHQDRRQFFRIDDTVSLSYQKVPLADLPARLEQMEHVQESNFTVVSSVAAITQKMAGVLHKIESRSSDVAAYLRSIDRKIELVARAFLAQNSDISEQPAHAVNMSATGMAFDASEALEVGDMLELKILLMPSFTGILIYAEVVGCDRLESDENDLPYLLRVNFSHMRDSDQDILISHVIQRQSVELRKRREARELD